jgi:hypothetical protein
MGGDGARGECGGGKDFRGIHGVLLLGWKKLSLRVSRAYSYQRATAFPVAGAMVTGCKRAVRSGPAVNI